MPDREASKSKAHDELGEVPGVMPDLLTYRTMRGSAVTYSKRANAAQLLYGPVAAPTSTLDEEAFEPPPDESRLKPQYHTKA